MPLLSEVEVTSHNPGLAFRGVGLSAAREAAAVRINMLKAFFIINLAPK
jgi:hypothetical protein